MQKDAVTGRKVAVLALLTAAWAAAGGTQSLKAEAIRKLHFSPDGRYILAQDTSEIMVLTVTPLAIFFRIPAEDVTDAQFTPDSQHVTFLSGGTRVGAAQIKFAKSGARVEYWSIAGRARMDPRELPSYACATERLSPDSRSFACDDLFGTLWLIDTASGRTILRKDGFGSHDYGWNGASVELRSGSNVVSSDPGLSVRMAFSPDARYVIAALQEHLTIARLPDIDLTPKEWWSGRAILWDLRLGNPVALKSHLNVLTDNAVAHPVDADPDRRRFFTFLAPDRLLVSDLFNAKNGNVTAELLEFPSGRVLSKPVLPAGELCPATDPNFVIVRLAGQDTLDRPQRTAAAELHTGELIVSETPALDVLGRYYVVEPSRGCVGLFERGKGLQAKIDLHKK
jgi:hypothetical protein